MVHGHLRPLHLGPIDDACLDHPGLAARVTAAHDGPEYWPTYCLPIQYVDNPDGSETDETDGSEGERGTIFCLILAPAGIIQHRDNAQPSLSQAKSPENMSETEWPAEYQRIGLAQICLVGTWEAVPAGRPNIHDKTLLFCDWKHRGFEKLRFGCSEDSISGTADNFSANSPFKDFVVCVLHVRTLCNTVMPMTQHI